MKNIFKTVLLMFVFLINFNFAFAAGNDYQNFGLDNSSLTKTFGTVGVPTIAGNVIKVLIGLSATVMLIMIIWSGFEIMFSSGKADTRKKAIDRIIWTAVGIIIIVGAYAISQFVMNQIKFLSK